MWNLKNYTNQPVYKTETCSQTLLAKPEVMSYKYEINRHTLLHKISNKDSVQHRELYSICGNNL